MYCQSCGIALAQQMKYCNRCGTLLITTGDDKVLKTLSEKRLDQYLEGLFWVTVLGLGFVFGGLIVLKKVQFSNWILIVYLCMSSTAFIINFAINLWGAIRLMKGAKEISPGAPDTSELDFARSDMLLKPAPTLSSITENTTRSFEPVYHERESE